MLIRPMSDLHLEFDHYYSKRLKLTDVWKPVELPGDAETTLLLVGDVWNKFKALSHSGRSWLGEMAGRFKHVVYVPGNHDFWTTNASTYVRRYRDKIADAGLSNVHLLDREYVDLDGVRFMGATMWTDMNRGDPHTAMSFSFTMANDHRFTRIGPTYRKLCHWHWLAEHQASKNWLRETLAATPPGMPVVVGTHFAPCTLSLDPQYAHDYIGNGFYASDLTPIMFDHPNIVLWGHGHVHKRSDYLMGNSRVICNPRGYLMQNEKTGFDERLVINTDDLDKLGQL